MVLKQTNLKRSNRRKNLIIALIDISLVMDKPDIIGLRVHKKAYLQKAQILKH